jgi:hypothetical protein
MASPALDAPAPRPVHLSDRYRKNWATRGSYFFQLDSIAHYRRRHLAEGKFSVSWIREVLREARRIRHTDTFHEEVIPGEDPPDLPALPAGWDRHIRQPMWGAF